MDEGGLLHCLLTTDVSGHLSSLGQGLAESTQWLPWRSECLPCSFLPHYNPLFTNSSLPRPCSGRGQRPMFSYRDSPCFRTPSDDHPDPPNLLLNIYSTCPVALSLLTPLPGSIPTPSDPVHINPKKSGHELPVPSLSKTLGIQTADVWFQSLTFIPEGLIACSGVVSIFP